MFAMFGVGSSPAPLFTGGPRIGGGRDLRGSPLLVCRADRGSPGTAERPPR